MGPPQDTGPLLSMDVQTYCSQTGLSNQPSLGAGPSPAPMWGSRATWDPGRSWSFPAIAFNLSDPHPLADSYLHLSHQGLSFQAPRPFPLPPLFPLQGHGQAQGARI